MNIRPPQAEMSHCRGVNVLIKEFSSSFAIIPSIHNICYCDCCGVVTTVASVTIIFFSGLNWAHVESGAVKSQALANLAPSGGTSPTFTISLLTGIALISSMNGKSSSATRPTTTRSSLSLSSSGLYDGVTVNSKAPPPRFIDTAPRVDGWMAVAVAVALLLIIFVLCSASMIGGTREANMESTRPKSNRFPGTSRHSCDPLYPTLMLA